MSVRAMPCLVVLGPLGSGKTTLVNLILKAYSEMRIMVVANDVGAKNVDADRIHNASMMRALTAGCIGCSDLPAFRKVLADAKQMEGLDLFLLEPTGIADGDEILTAMQEAGCEFRAITLIDVKHFHRNLALGCMESQLRPATAVVLSWQDAPNQDLTEVLEFIGRHAPGCPIVTNYSHTQGEVTSLLEMVMEHAAADGDDHSHDHGHSHHHGHEHSHAHRHGHDHNGDHDHNHAGDHGVYSFSLDIQPDTDFATLLETLAPHLSTLVRAKGVVAGRSFDFVQGDVAQGEEDASEPYGNFIFNRPVDVELFAVITKPGEVDQLTRKERIQTADVPLEATLAAITWQLQQYPAVLTPGGDVRVDCEADVCYQLSKRHGVPLEVRAAVLRQYVAWRVEAVRALAGQAVSESPDLAFRLRRLGLNLAYMCAVKPDLVGEALCEQVAGLQPAEILAKGLLGLEELSFNEEQAEEKPETVSIALRFGSVDVGLCERALAHCLKLAAGNAAWEERWRQCRVDVLGD